MVDLARPPVPRSPERALNDLGPLDERFLRLIDGRASLGVIAVGILVALVAGAAHGLAPGHGKAMGAAYLVGTRGRIRDAIWLGVTVAGMHTASVLLLALGLHVLLRSSTTNLPAAALEASPILRLISGVIVLIVGAWLAVRSYRFLKGQRHEHEHDHDHPSPLSRRGLVALGVSGGLLPSPSAFLVLATAAFTGRTALGLLLVAAFSVGLATTVTVVGVVAVRGRELLSRRGPSRLASHVERFGPVLAAAVVLTVGAALTLGALGDR